jgi:hypothetical protein
VGDFGVPAEEAATVAVNRSVIVSKQRIGNVPSKSTHEEEVDEDASGLGVFSAEKTSALLDEVRNEDNNNNDCENHIVNLPPLVGENLPPALTTNNEDAVSAISSFYSSKGENTSEQKMLTARATKYILLRGFRNFKFINSKVMLEYLGHISSDVLSFFGHDPYVPKLVNDKPHLEKECFEKQEQLRRYQWNILKDPIVKALNVARGNRTSEGKRCFERK